jgi:Family of unknown function (DUF5519)
MLPNCQIDDDVGMLDWQLSLIRRCAELDGAAIGEGAFRPGPAVWVGRREIAHFDDESTFDIRLTRRLIRARRSELIADERIRLRSGSSDWLEVEMSSPSNASFALAMVEDAIAANVLTAPPGPPPTGADLARRRRSH